MSNGPESRLRELGITLPAPPVPGGNYVPAKTVSHMVYLSGVVSADASGLVTGAVGLDRTIEEGYAALRASASPPMTRSTSTGYTLEFLQPK